MYTNGKREGFVVMEMIIAVGVIMALTGGVATVWNSRNSFPQARDLQRIAHTDTISKAIAKNSDSNDGVFKCVEGPIPKKAARISSRGYNIAPCLIPEYLSALPVDPSSSNAYWVSVSDYDTGYRIERDAATGRVVVSAPGAELANTLGSVR